MLEKQQFQHVKEIATARPTQDKETTKNKRVQMVRQRVCFGKYKTQESLLSLILMHAPQAGYTD